MTHEDKIKYYSMIFRFLGGTAEQSYNPSKMYDVDGMLYSFPKVKGVVQSPDIHRYHTTNSVKFDTSYDWIDIVLERMNKRFFGKFFLETQYPFVTIRYGIDINHFTGEWMYEDFTFFSYVDIGFGVSHITHLFTGVCKFLDYLDSISMLEGNRRTIYDKEE